jgi:hypothetical protein
LVDEFPSAWQKRVKEAACDAFFPQPADMLPAPSRLLYQHRH